MNSIQVTKLDNSRAEIGVTDLENLKGSLRGSLIFQEDEGYDQARTIWNAMIDRKPALIIRCKGTADVITAVNFVRTHGLLTSIRGGGHNIAGNAVCEGGVMIDLSQLRSVRIDPLSQKAYVEPGATLGDFDREAQTFGMATPLGINSTTGVAGLTLGAGFGWLSRKYGMTIDNLTGVDIITADGKFLHANDKNNPDLFWAIRGGGGNFGVVTNFEFRLHPVGPEILGGLIVYSLKEGAQVLRKFRDHANSLSDDTVIWAVMRKAPPLPFLPQAIHGTEVIVIVAFHSGDLEKGHNEIEPARNFGKVLGEFVAVQPYAAWQTMFDPLLSPGARNYWKSHNFSELPDAAIDLAINYASSLPSPQCELLFGQLGGAAARISPDATAYPHRNTNFILNVHGRWESPTDDTKCIEWARTLLREAEPYATGGVYVNFITGDETNRVSAAYGSHLERLMEIKKKYDPENLFRVNQNIKPGELKHPKSVGQTMSELSGN